MSSPRNPGAGEDPDDPLDDDVPPVPDEDGPHDVPDETVIEKTLPTAPRPDRGASSLP
ncbi:MAG TPA: hypothetical protein VLI46_02225 [Ramlibacter sp.]|nr:hypothetical protein [Ramlibacter sp.]